MQLLHRDVGLVNGDRGAKIDIRDGVGLTVNLEPDQKSGMIGWRARKHAG